jgi:hypothetical protein
MIIHPRRLHDPENIVAGVDPRIQSMSVYGFVIDPDNNFCEFFRVYSYGVDATIAIKSIGEKAIFFFYKQGIFSQGEFRAEGTFRFAPNSFYKPGINLGKEYAISFGLLDHDRFIDPDFAFDSAGLSELSVRSGHLVTTNPFYCSDNSLALCK